MNPLFSYDAVIARAKTAFGCAKNKELAALLGMTPQTLSNRKATQSIPYQEIVAAAVQAGLDVQYILTGQHAVNERGADYEIKKAAESNGKCPAVGHLELLPEEKSLLECYRNSPKVLQDAALRVLSGAGTNVGETGKAKIEINGNVGQSVGSQTASHFTIDMRQEKEDN